MIDILTISNPDVDHWPLLTGELVTPAPYKVLFMAGKHTSASKLVAGLIANIEKHPRGFFSVVVSDTLVMKLIGLQWELQQQAVVRRNGLRKMQGSVRMILFRSKEEVREFAQRYTPDAVVVSSLARKNQPSHQTTPEIPMSPNGNLG